LERAARRRRSKERLHAKPSIKSVGLLTALPLPLPLPLAYEVARDRLPGSAPQRGSAREAVDFDFESFNDPTVEILGIKSTRGGGGSRNE